jgi:hypothetical protein
MATRMVVVVLGVLLVAAPAASAGETREHSGRIVSEDQTRHTLAIEEMGPWYGPGTKPVRRAFRLAPTTKVELAFRKPERGGGWGEFAVEPIKASDLRLGDYATVTLERLGKKLVATEVSIVRPTGGSEPRPAQRKAAWAMPGKSVGS